MMGMADRHRQRIGRIGAADDGVGQQARIELLLAANEVGPADRVVVVEPEAVAG